ncbi:MAG TPA: response regulator [Clostridia bacterium]|nr:response regulator [Clostridia bacterium]
MIRTVIVDDEQPSLDKLERLLTDSGLAEIKGKFTEPLEALEFLKKNEADAVFLDIEMPDIDGIELSNNIIGLQRSIAVVFVTAYNQYAVEAFRLNALDYLMKPVTLERLMETLNRVVEEKGIKVRSCRIQVQCFDKFSVISGTGEVKFRTGKAEELLAFLIDRRGGSISRRELIDCLWEDFDGDRALIHFNTTLHYVKKALLLHGIQIPIIYERGCYRFGMEGLNCDYLKFHAFIDSAAAVDLKNIREYEAAAELYTGDYLAGREYEWAERKRQLLRERFIHLLIAISDYYKTGGIYQKATEWLKTGLMHEPLHRELNYMLIEMLLLTNDRISAARYYNIYSNGLRKKLNQEPDEAFRRLLR